MKSREIAIKILYEVFQNKAYSNIVLNNKLNNAQLSYKDKAFITQIVYGTIKYKLTIDRILNQYICKGLKSLKPNIQNILRSAIYQIRYLDRIPDFAVVNESVEIAKKYSSLKVSRLVNGVLRNYLRNKYKKYYNNEDIVDKLCFTYSFPEWLVKLFIEQYNVEKAEKILNGLNEVSGVTVRVNNLKANYDDVIETLQKLNYSYEEGIICPEAIRILKGKSIEDNPLFKDGKIIVQDESAMLVSSIMDLKKNLNVLDLCSAPGGKACHIADIMENTGQIYCFDIHKNKLNLIMDNAKRLKVTNIKTNVMDASVYNEKFNSFADRVLIDVPCSGLGIIKKKPEIKYRKSYGQLKQLQNIQRKILLNASKYVKVNGLLVYSTCTLNKEENEYNIDWFIKNNSNYKIEPIYFGNVENVLYNEKGYVTIIPNKSMDGFFIAKLRRIW